MSYGDLEFGRLDHVFRKYEIRNSHTSAIAGRDLPILHTTSWTPMTIRGRLLGLPRIFLIKTF